MGTGDTSTLDEIIEAARRVAQRLGHAQLTAAHFIIALNEQAPIALRRHYTDADIAAIESALEREAIGNGSLVADPRIEAIIRHSRTAIDPIDEFAASLRSFLPTLPEDPLAEFFEWVADSEAPESQADETDALPTRPAIFGIKNFASIAPVDPPLADRLDDAAAVVSISATREPQAAIVSAPDGSGRTTFARCLSAYLAGSDYRGGLKGWPVVTTKTEKILNYGLSTALGKVLDACKGKALVYIDDIDVLAALSTANPDLGVLNVMRGALHNPAHRVVFAINDGYLDRLQAANREFHDELVQVRLKPLAESQTTGIARATAAELAVHHGVSISDDVIAAALEPPGQGDHLVHPGLAIERLDYSASEATTRADRLAKPAWLEGDMSRRVDTMVLTGIAERLKAHVLGQDHVIDAVVRRLRVTTVGLDERPDRPDGVFLFAGPTGTGKTELATQLASEVYGTPDHLIRLDMSEYSDRWSTTKLIGPGPGYLGSQEPEGWLTTRVRRNPHAVLLLDEIEKADPVVWTAFLQVFDAGRLTDGAGRVADFRDIIVVMTSNVGASHFAERNRTGFVAQEPNAEVQTAKVLGELRQVMPLELLNRVDELLVFYPLSPQVMGAITQAHLDRAIARLASHGWIVTMDTGVVTLVASMGFDRALGARPLLRVIERDIIAPITELPVGEVRLLVEHKRVIAISA